jgi:NAD(P)-dependent dehydrogenase (short-subunit alcohol dehydrogenase family)
MTVAIITGASRGFGRALATDLVSDGWKVVVTGRHRAPLHEVAATLAAAGGTVTPVVGDVTDPLHRAAVVTAAQDLGGVDLLVNNASELGPSPLPALRRFPVDILRRVYEVNVIAPLALVQLALPELRAVRGTVVSVSSDAAVEAYPGWGGYGSSKAALDQLHQVLAVEEPQLRVVQFDPGDMRTDMHQAAFPGEDISDRPEPESVVPALRLLLESAAPSGRYRAAEWVAV